MVRIFTRFFVAASLGTLMVLAGCSSSATSRDAVEMVDDGGLTARVKTALATEEVETLLNIEVESYRGVVQLNGFVDSDDMIAMAGEIVEGVEGVMEVQNNLQVKPAQ